MANRKKRKKAGKGKALAAGFWKEPDWAHKNKLAQQRFIQILHTSGNDLTLVVLRGHLLLEELLFDFLKTVASNPDQIDRLGLMFGKALDIARAFDAHDNDSTWLIVQKVNTLRNELAHHAQPDGVEKTVYEIGKMVPRTEGIFPTIDESPAEVAEMCRIVSRVAARLQVKIQFAAASKPLPEAADVNPPSGP